MAYILENYEPVEARLDAFWQQYPNGRIQTEVLEKTETSILIKAFLYKDINDTNAVATGLAEEIKDTSPVNRVSWVENCETSALGRALANFNFAAKGKRASREEMEKVQRQTEAPAPAPTPELIADAQEAQSQVADIKTVAELKNFYDGVSEAGLLQVPVNGVTLNSLIAKQKKVLEAKK